MSQEVGTLAGEQDNLRVELYKLLSEGINKDGEGNSNLIGREIFHFSDISCERTGLYY